MTDRVRRIGQLGRAFRIFAVLVLMSHNANIGVVYGVESHNMRVVVVTGIFTAVVSYLLIRYWVLEDVEHSHD